MEAGRELDALVAGEKAYRCRRCGGSQFARYAANGRRYCPSCARNQRRRWYAANKTKVAEARRDRQISHDPKVKEYRRRWQLRSRYGISDAQYSSLLSEQRGVCAICATPPGVGRLLCVDHCHDSGEVRGLLCDACNNGLARFKDDPIRLMQAIAYLAKKEAI